MNTRSVGSKAEDAVAEYAQKNGYKLIQRNYVTPYGEADIIFADGEEYVFVEVKARKSDKYGKPAEAVTKRKIARYLQISQYFFLSNSIDDYRVRFDVAEVFINSGKYEINYIENAFDFTNISDFY